MTGRVSFAGKKFIERESNKGIARKVSSRREEITGKDDILLTKMLHAIGYKNHLCFL
jgi:hypothetical protein